MIRMSRCGFVYFLAVLLTVTLLVSPVFAKGGFGRWGEYELVCDDSEPMLQNPNTEKTLRIFGKVDRALAKAICELKAFTEECECVPVNPPVIMEIAVESITDSTATIEWTTDELSDSEVRYSNTPSSWDLYPLENVVLDPSMTLSHSLTIIGLDPNTTYYLGAALLRRPLLTVSGSLYCIISANFPYLITFR